MVATVVMGTVHWSGFQYDNICPVDAKKGKYEYCYQDFRHAIMAPEYMDKRQHITERIFEAASTIITIVVAVKINCQIHNGYRALCSSVYKPVGADKK